MVGRRFAGREVLNLSGVSGLEVKDLCVLGGGFTGREVLNLSGVGGLEVEDLSVLGGGFAGREVLNLFGVGGRSGVGGSLSGQSFSDRGSKFGSAVQLSLLKCKSGLSPSLSSGYLNWSGEGSNAMSSPGRWTGKFASGLRCSWAQSVCGTCLSFDKNRGRPPSSKCLDPTRESSLSEVNPPPLPDFLRYVSGSKNESARLKSSDNDCPSLRVPGHPDLDSELERIRSSQIPGMETGQFCSCEKSMALTGFRSTSLEYTAVCCSGSEEDR